MLSHSGSDTGSSLQRSKSTLSVKERRKHLLQAQRIDPRTAHSHALIAARRAVNKSGSQASGDLARSESLMSNKTTTSHQEQGSRVSPASHLRRQRSTLQNRVPKLADTLKIPDTQVQPYEGNRTNVSNTEWGVAGENYGAEPSSYRRLKRSRSLLTPARPVRRPNSRTPESTLSQDSTLRPTGSPIVVPSPGLKVRLKRSLNFLRYAQPVPSRVITAPAQLQSQQSCHPEALELARSQYLEELGQQQLTKKPSLLFSSKTKRAQKAFRKSFRTGEETVDRSLSPEPGKVLLEKATTKSVSASLSGKLRKIFTRSKHNGSLPPQQLEASRPHFNLDLDTANPEAGFDSYLETGPQVDARNSLYFPSDLELDLNDDFEKLSHSRSCESSSSKSRSRVTSWTNSTVSSSAAGPNLPCELKRLSVIKEDGGPHQPSSSVGRHLGGVVRNPVSTPRHHFGDVPALQQPLNIPPGQQVDSQRIYSALVKRLDDEQKEMERTETAFKTINAAREQDDVVGHYLFPVPTIRRVKSKGSTSLRSIQEDDSQQHRAVAVQHRDYTPQNWETQHIHVKKRGSEPSHQNLLPHSHAISEKETIASRTPSHDSLSRSEVQSEDQASYNSELETGSLVRKYDSITSNLANTAEIQSTESVYSRTTNGGTNCSYVTPTESTETFETEGDASTRRNILLPSQYCKSRLAERHSSRNGLNFDGGTSGKGPWKEWMRYQTASLETGKPHRRTQTHMREHAQINPADADVGCTQNRQFLQRLDTKTSSSQLSQPYNKSQHFLQISQGERPSRLSQSPKSNFCLKEVPQKCYPIPRINSFIGRSQSALLNQVDTTLQPVVDDRKSSPTRKISSSDTIEIPKRRKGQATSSKSQSPGKENSPISTGDSPPVSTPGRYSVSTCNGDKTSRLRKGKSTIGFGDVDHRVRKGDCSTTLHDSPSEKLRNKLSARLSKPFDIDVPDHNRPFDSTYLGKHESGNRIRLSDATNGITMRQPKTYGNLSLISPTCHEHGERKTNGDVGSVLSTANELRDDARSEEFEPTALPPLTMTSNTQRSVSGLSLGLASRRIVSGLLKNRKRQQDDVRGTSLAGDSAFI